MLKSRPQIDALKFNADGLIPAIVQEAAGGSEPGRVLMLAWMNDLALEKTLETGLMHYWSRSRRKLWLKGESSGHTQEVVAWFRDCDGDALLFQVRQRGGAACHTGYASCFFQPLTREGEPAAVTESPVFDPAEVYRENPAHAVSVSPPSPLPTASR